MQRATNGDHQTYAGEELTHDIDGSHPEPSAKHEEEYDLARHDGEGEVEDPFDRHRG